MDTRAEKVPALEGQDVSEPVFLEVFEEAVGALEDSSLPYVLIGGVGSAVLGRPRWTHDIDFLVRPHDAKATLEALAVRGFETQETDPGWLFKAVKHDCLVDILFKTRGDIYLDDEMIQRSSLEELKGRRVRTISPEDLLVIKAIAHDEQTPRHWNDALSLIATCNLDWEYLIRRAQHGIRRVLSLLIYAQSNDLAVPQRVIAALFASIYDEDKKGLLWGDPTVNLSTT